MTPEQRRQAVGDMLAEDPTLSQRDIAKALGVSQSSVRRDVKALSQAMVTQLESVGLISMAQVSRGETLVARLRGEMAEQGLIPTSVEEEHLLTARSLADRIERLQAMVKLDGASVKAKDGTVRLHPALAEMRQCESVLTRVVSGISTTEAAPKNPVKQKAAQTRWRAHNLKAVERDRQAADPYGT
jgi:DNA-binding Lrp family transcriptional regulator